MRRRQRCGRLQARAVYQNSRAVIRHKIRGAANPMCVCVYAKWNFKLAMCITWVQDELCVRTYKMKNVSMFVYMHAYRYHNVSHALAISVIQMLEPCQHSFNAHIQKKNIDIRTSVFAFNQTMYCYRIYKEITFSIHCVFYIKYSHFPIYSGIVYLFFFFILWVNNFVSHNLTAILFSNDFFLWHRLLISNNTKLKTSNSAIPRARARYRHLKRILFSAMSPQKKCI